MTTSPPPKPDIRSLLENGFTEETARSLYAQGEAVVVFALMQLAALALKTQDINGTHPSTPSATVPAFQKEPGKKRKKKPGAKPGHKGSRRPPPVVNRHETHRLENCPDCGTKLNKRKQALPRRQRCGDGSDGEECVDDACRSVCTGYVVSARLRSRRRNRCLPCPRQRRCWRYR